MWHLSPQQPCPHQCLGLRYQCITIVYQFVLSLPKSALLVISFCYLVVLYPVSLSDGLCGEIQYVLVTGCVRDLLDEVHFLGNNIANQPFTTENASQCRQECTKNDTCQYFTFVDENAGIEVHRYMLKNYLYYAWANKGSNIIFESAPFG